MFFIKFFKYFYCYFNKCQFIFIFFNKSINYLFLKIQNDPSDGVFHFITFVFNFNFM